MPTNALHLESKAGVLFQEPDEATLYHSLDYFGGIGNERNWSVGIQPPCVLPWLKDRSNPGCLPDLTYFSGVPDEVSHGKEPWSGLVWKVLKCLVAEAMQTPLYFCAVGSPAYSQTLRACNDTPRALFSLEEQWPGASQVAIAAV